MEMSLRMLYQTTMNGMVAGCTAGVMVIMPLQLHHRNGGHGALMGHNSELRMDNSLIAYNSGNGIVTDGAVDLNYMNVLHNGGRASTPTNSRRSTTASCGSMAACRR